MLHHVWKGKNKGEIAEKKKASCWVSHEAGREQQEFDRFYSCLSLPCHIVSLKINLKKIIGHPSFSLNIFEIWRGWTEAS
jgi:hypothetical protein